MNTSLVLRLPRKMHLCRSCSNFPRLPSFLEMLQNPHVLLILDKVRNPLCLPRETSYESPKMVRTWRALYILTSKFAARHNGVHFLDITTSTSGPSVVCFVHFDFNVATSKSAPNFVCLVHFDVEICFTPQRRAISYLSSG